MAPPKGRNYPFSSRNPASWFNCHVSYEQAVEMFYSQTATQQYMGHNPIVQSKVFRGIKYSTIEEAQEVSTKTLNAEYLAKEQRDLTDENRGCTISKKLNDSIRNRIIPTENGLESALSHRTPFAQSSNFSLSQLNTVVQQNDVNAATPRPSAAQQAYDFTEPEWNASLIKDSKKYQWNISDQENISIAVLLVDEAEEYLQQLKNDTYGEMSTGKNHAGVATGLKSAYEVAKELGGFGATANAVSINGAMHIVIEKYNPRYLDLGIRWQAATPQMLKLGYALNTVQGNISVVKGNVFVEIVFSGAINAVDYMLHDEKTLGEVVGRFSGDVAKGIVTGIAAQGAALLVRGLLVLFTGMTLPLSVTLGAIVILSFAIGAKLSELDNKHQYTKPMTEKVEALFNEN